MALAESAGAGKTQPGSPAGRPGRPGDLRIGLVAIALCAFALYWVSALIIASSNRQHLFGSDAYFYAQLAGENVAARIGSDYWLDRATRFHPTTTVMALAWMKLFSPLTAWMSPQQLLRAMFAFVGAVGVWTAMIAFAAFVPRRQVPVWGIIYAVSLGTWFFSSIEESKIVTATLTTLYIVVYLRLRTRWTLRGVALLTAVLLVACVNEIVAAFLVAIPAIDTLVRRGWDLRCGRWIVWHGLAAPFAFVLLEAVVHRYTGAATSGGPAGEAVSHFDMLMFYLTQNDFSAASLYGFLANWLFFSIAAPTVVTTLAALPEQPQFVGFFAPALANYLSTPVSSALAAVFGVMLAASLVPRFRRERIGGDMAAMLLAMLAYTLVRGAFYFIVNSRECFLYASGVTLVHLLVLAALFAASNFPAQRGLLAACALLLFIVNGTFIIGP
jgi:hypothetical protein